MKHISEILSVRKRILERERMFSLFSGASEKGSGEWSTFNAVRDDRVSAYSTRLPKKPIVIEEPRHVLRIVYPASHLKSA